MTKRLNYAKHIEISYFEAGDDSKVAVKILDRLAIESLKIIPLE